MTRPAMTLQTPSSIALRTAAAALAAALLPLAAAAQTAGDTPTTDSPAQWEVDDRVDRPEQGAMSGTVVLIDPENLILETSDGDRAFALDGATRLPAVLRDSEDWSEVEGFPVEVVFRPGADGELRIVESLSLLPVESQETAEPEVESVVAEAEPAAGTAGEGTVRTAALTSTDAPAEEAAPAAEDEPVVATASALRPGEPGTVAAESDEGDAESAAVEPATTRAAGSSARAGAAERPDGELPPTASRIPWVGLAGLLCLGCAFGLRAAGRLRA